MGPLHVFSLGMRCRTLFLVTVGGNHLSNAAQYTLHVCCMFFSKETSKNVHWCSPNANLLHISLYMRGALPFDTGIQEGWHNIRRFQSKEISIQRPRHRNIRCGFRGLHRNHDANHARAEGLERAYVQRAEAPARGDESFMHTCMHGSSAIVHVLFNQAYIMDAYVLDSTKGEGNRTARQAARLRSLEKRVYTLKATAAAKQKPKIEIKC